MLPAWQPFTTDPGVLFQGGPVALDSALGLALLPPASSDDGAAGLAARRRAARPGRPRHAPRGAGRRAGRLRIFAGYAGWGAGQLEDELAEGAWYVVPATADGASRRRSAQPLTRCGAAVLRRQGGDLAMVSTYLDDPSLN